MEHLVYGLIVAYVVFTVIGWWRLRNDLKSHGRIDTADEINCAILASIMGWTYGILEVVKLVFKPFMRK
jgi:hypothetical protein